MSNYIRGVEAKVKHLFNKNVLPLNAYIENIAYKNFCHMHVLQPESNKETSMAPRKLSFPHHNSVSQTSKKPKIEKQPHILNVPKFQYTKGTSLGNMSKASRIFQRPQTNSSRGYIHTIPKVLQIITFVIVQLYLQIITCFTCTRYAL